MQSELKTLQKMQTELRSELRMKSSHGARSAYERLFRKDHEVKRYMGEATEMKSKLEEERSQLSSSIEALQNDTSERKKTTEMMELPSKEEMDLMKDEVAFTGKHLDANQETITLLQQQKKSRMEEVSLGDHNMSCGCFLQFSHFDLLYMLMLSAVGTY